MTKNSHPYLEAVADRVLIYDGAMGTNIQRYKLTADDFDGKEFEGCNDYLVLTRPDVIREIHESFLAVGCDVIETCTFQSTPRRLHEWGLGDKVHELNVAAARLARDVASKYSTPEQPRFVAGSIGPTGMLPSSDDPTLSAIMFDELSENFYQQAKALIEGGVDVLLVETAQDILEVKAALAGFERLFAELGRRIPVQAQVTLDTSGRMLLGTDIASAMTTLESLPVDIIGLNCSTGPEHVRATHGQGVVRNRSGVPRVSSAMRAITLHQDPPPLLVGERVNSQGSRKVKRLLLADDYEGILEVAREQVESGAHVLDVCVAVPERADEAEQMARVVKLLSMTVEQP